MSDGEQRYIQELADQMRHHNNHDEIIFEYEQHIYEMNYELPQDEQLTYDQIVARLGEPEQIAKMWRSEIKATPKKMQWLFVLMNAVIFLGGVILTISYHVFEFTFIDQLWYSLTNASFIIIFIYILFWGLLGYEIGREFGHRGRRLLQKTFLICMIPNVLFMYLVVVKVLPYKWFDPLLNIPFIIVCIIFIGLLYPVSIFGYLWGRKGSV